MVDHGRVCVGKLLSQYSEQGLILVRSCNLEDLRIKVPDIRSRLGACKPLEGIQLRCFPVPVVDGLTYDPLIFADTSCDIDPLLDGIKEDPVSLVYLMS